MPPPRGRSVPALGQQTMEGSTPVAIASDQTPLPVSAPGGTLATEAKQDSQIAILSTLGTEATLASILAALSPLATEITLGQVLTALGLVATEATLLSVDSKLPALGQTTSDSSQPVTVSTDNDAYGERVFISNDNAHVDADVEGTIYAVAGVKLKTGITAKISLESVSVLCTTNDDFQAIIILNPVVAGTFTYSNYSTSTEFALGVTANTVTGGTRLGHWFSPNQSDLNKQLNYFASNLELTETDQIVLCVMPTGGGADIHGAIGVRVHV